MIRLILIISFLGIKIMFGQSPVAKSEDGKVEVFENYIKYKKGRKWNTIHLTEGTEIYDSCEIQTIQIDKKGLKEVVITWINHNHGSYGTGGFQTDYKTNEIWNLDTQQKIFTAQSEYLSFQSVSKEYSDVPSKADTVSWLTICSYSYDFSVDKNGNVIIQNLKEDYSQEIDIYNWETDITTTVENNSATICSDQKPDKREGIYIYRKGFFLWAGKKD